MAVSWIKSRSKNNVSPFNFTSRSLYVRWLPHGLVIPSSLIKEGTVGYIIGIDNEKLKMYLKPTKQSDLHIKEAYRLYMYNSNTNWFINTATLTKNINKELGVEFNPRGGMKYPVEFQNDGMIVMDISEVVKKSVVYQDYISSMSVLKEKNYVYNE